MSDETPQLQFDFIKSPQYREIHVDGAFGGLTPRGLVSMSLYSERFAIPQSVWHDISKDGQISGEVRREGRKAIIRSVDATVIFDLETARAMHSWLSRAIAGLEANQQDETKLEDTK